MVTAVEAPRLSGHMVCLSDIDYGGVLGYYARGHEPIEDVIAALDWDYEEIATAELVSQEWWRWVPYGAPGEGQMMQQRAEPHSRGAFRVTYWDRDGQRIEAAWAKRRRT